VISDFSKTGIMFEVFIFFKRKELSVLVFLALSGLATLTGHFAPQT
jgi:hypothetical protein